MAVGRAIWPAVGNGGGGKVSGHLRKTDMLSSAAASQGTEEHVRKRDLFVETREQRLPKYNLIRWHHCIRLYKFCNI